MIDCIDGILANDAAPCASVNAALRRFGIDAQQALAVVPVATALSSINAAPNPFGPRGLRLCRR